MWDAGKWTWYHLNMWIFYWTLYASIYSGWEILIVYTNFKLKYQEKYSVKCIIFYKITWK